MLRHLPRSTHASSDRHAIAFMSTSRGLTLALLSLPLLVMLVVALFAWPAARTEPRDLPFGLVGPAQMTDEVATSIERNGFAVRHYVDEASARDAIMKRETYGALLLTEQGPTLLTASAASPVVAQMLREAAGGLAVADPDAPSASLTVIDVVPTASNDPRGAVFGASVLPLVLAGTVTGAALAFTTLPGWRQIYGLIGVSALTGLAVTIVVQTWLDAISGNWWINAGAISLMLLAIAAVVAGGAAIVGPPGVAFGVVLMLAIGNPWSGIASAPELLPRWVGTIGQLLPPGAGGQLLRSTAFFDGAGSLMPFVGLVTWIGIGVAAIWAGAIWMRKHPTARDAGQPTEVQLTTARL